MMLELHSSQGDVKSSAVWFPGNVLKENLLQRVLLAGMQVAGAAILWYEAEVT
jgi:hypothetical protein